MHRLPLTERLLSARNHIFWTIRTHFRFRREGYLESGDNGSLRTDTEANLEKKYGLGSFAARLSPEVYKKNLWTLWVLDRLVAPHLRTDLLELEIAEPGCQDFARIPSLRLFFRNFYANTRITGIEVDPFPLLHGFHSRWDKAKYYLNLVNAADRYVEGDYFLWNDPVDLICCFYPFVSINPALAWGLPSYFGNPKPWILSFRRNMKPGALLVLVHQGAWEEEEFDKARHDSGLLLLERAHLDCDFYPLPHPACVSVYQREW